MKADYDSEANAILIELVEVDRWDDGDEIDEYYCTVAFADGQLVGIGLLYPSENLHLLEVVAQKFDLDAEALKAVAQAALAAPDRPVTVSVGTRVAA